MTTLMEKTLPQKLGKYIQNNHPKGYRAVSERQTTELQMKGP